MLPIVQGDDGKLHVLVVLGLYELEAYDHFVHFELTY
jgi:hypothetical protein